jgi:hypothetical protein
VTEREAFLYALAGVVDEEAAAKVGRTKWANVPIAAGMMERFARTFDSPGFPARWIGVHYDVRPGRTQTIPYMGVLPGGFVIPCELIVLPLAVFAPSSEWWLAVDEEKNRFAQGNGSTILVSTRYIPGPHTFFGDGFESLVVGYAQQR